MQVKNYPFGKPSKQLKSAVKWLNSNQKNLKATMLCEFDFPYFLDMPKKIVEGLLEDELNFICGETFDWWYPNYLNQMHEYNKMPL